MSYLGMGANSEEATWGDELRQTITELASAGADTYASIMKTRLESKMMRDALREQEKLNAEEIRLQQQVLAMRASSGGGGGGAVPWGWIVGGTLGFVALMAVFGRKKRS